MSEYTENLNLFKYNTVDDAKLPFSIDTAMNANWDIIDTSIEGLQTQIDEIEAGQGGLTSNCVKKTGDTMSGNLTISKSGANLNITNTNTASNYSGITLKHNNLDTTSTTAPTANINAQRIVFTDKADKVNGWLQYTYNTSNNIYCGMGVRRVVGGANKDCQITLGVDATGTAFTTAPTPASTDNSTKIATTAFVKSALSGSGNGLATISKASNGYCKFNNGLIIQWGRTGTLQRNTNTTVKYPIAFTSTNYKVITTWHAVSNDNIDIDDVIITGGYTTTQCNFYSTQRGANDGTWTVAGSWIAIGY